MSILGMHAQGVLAQQPSDQIRLNQIGFYPDAPKRAAIVDADAGTFSVHSSETGQEVLSGELGESRVWTWSGEAVRLADFSDLTDEGMYYLQVDGVGNSYPFVVAQRAHQEIARATLKALYFQRASAELLPEHAGAWARQAGHPDDQVEVHASAATETRPAGTIIAAPRGWYDAGDYNKYIVPAAFTSYVLLAGLEHYPSYFEALHTNIPESDNGIPDVLDEALWNLRFMFDMQDPEDGGVYHKLSTANFQGTVAPHVPTATRYVVQKSTTAALDFAAAAAQVSRIASNYPDDLPGLADSALTAALRAWNWARTNPAVAYNQNIINQNYSPSINTGEYGDGNRSDEFAWAATELYVTTGQDSFHQAVSIFQNNSTPGWASVNMLGYVTLARHPSVTDAGAALKAEAEQRLIQVADEYVDSYRNSAMGTAIGLRAGNFGWGSTGTAGGIGMALIQAFELTGEQEYLDAAISVLDYLMGLNGTGYSYLSGFGGRPILRPHHRPSESDAVAAPVPGLLSGGPNPGQQDNCTYSSNLPASSFLDSYCSYASNEITTYWNAPLTYVAAAVESAYGNVPLGDPPPYVLAPLPGELGVPRFATLSWDAAAPYDRFHLQVADAPHFAAPVFDDADVGRDHEMLMLSAGRAYYWRVRSARNGEESAWGPVGTFSLASAPVTSFYRESDGLVVMEAENRSGLVTNPRATWTFFRTVEGSVGRTGYGGPNTGRSFGDDFLRESSMMYFDLRLSAPGVWYPWVRIFGGEEDDDAVHVGWNAQPLTMGDPVEAGEASGTWHWRNQTRSGQRVAIEVDAAGIYALTLWMHEDGVLVDRLLLTNNPDFVPEGEGPAESAIGDLTSVQAEVPLDAFRIDTIYPSPFTSSAVVTFALPVAADVRVSLFDLTGRRIAVLRDGMLQAGIHHQKIDGDGLAAGAYLVRLESGGLRHSKMTFLVR